MKNLKEKLDQEVKKRNTSNELSEDAPDPLMIAKKQDNDLAILTCALFAYGNAKQIVKFLKKLPLDLIGKKVSEEELRVALKELKYRFKSNEGIVQWFLLLQRINALKVEFRTLFLKEYKKQNDIVYAIESEIGLFHKYLCDYQSRGMDFLIGKKGTGSPLKRWNMFLRWMVRDDNLDLGRWKEIETKDLLVPLDTHTFKLGKEFGLIKSKTYNLKAARELTTSLKKFDKEDPVKYDFAIYRLGQEKRVN